MKKLFPFMNLVLIILLCISTVFISQKLNTKINNLNTSLLSMQESLDKEASTNLQCSIIPDLNTYGEGWKITQFGDVQQQRELCYTITTDTGLVIIDGGHAYEEERLLKIIEKYNNSVEAWILTHPHSDHITSFLDIYENHPEIQIHHVYVAEYPSEELLKKNAKWDRFECLERFRTLDIPEKEFLHKGDKLNLMGLDMEVLSAYNDTIDEISRDLMNNGSLVFRLSGKQETMLFTADIGSAGSEKNREIMTRYMVDEYGDYLKSDYVQMSHHGFQGLKKEFYEKVAPKAAFMDSSGDLLRGENENFDAGANEEMMREMGAVVYTYYTTPNQIILK